MTDRSSSETIGDFVLSTDRDHRGNYRGNQVMSSSWRQWHFHIDSDKYSQQRIVELIEAYLREIGATPLSKPSYGIGNIEKPELLTAWELFGKTAILWISSVTHKLHVEADKDSFQAKAILTKRALTRILYNKRFPEVK